MKLKLLSAVAATALLFGTAAVQAQGQNGDPNAGQGQNYNAQSGGLQGGEPGAQGVCPPEKCPQGAAQAPDSGTMQNGQAQQQGQQAPAEGQANQQPAQDQNQPAQGQAQSQPDQNTNQAAGENGTGKKKNQMQSRQNNQQEEPTTTGAIKAPAKITEKERTEIRTTIKDVHVEPVAHVDFDINVGVAVPSTIVLHPLPPRIVALVPAYEGYEFFVLADGTIVIVDPGTLHIVYVIA